MNFQKKYTNRDILIIGGGTSTIDRKWEKVVKPDTFVWTCNDFHLNSRVLKQTIDLYQLAFTTDLTNPKLIQKLKQDRPFVYFEYDHYRRKWATDEFKSFERNIGYAVPGMNIDMGEWFYQPAQKSGAMLRLILLSLVTNAKNIYFVGFDGFNREFSNIHAFTGQIGLKESDIRRDWDKTELSYVNVFTDAYKLLASNPTCKRLQNLGEGLDYNLGTPISKQYFPLRSEIYEAIR
jgi:hypothetical protein